MSARSLFVSMVLFFAAMGVVPQGHGDLAAVVKASELRGKTWYNAGRYKRVSMKALRGKVVLVFFWSCDDSSSQELLPMLNAWYSQYEEKSFEIIGVQSFLWEHNASETELYRIIRESGIRFPVVIEEGSSLFLAYGQQMRPSFSLVDRDGYLRAQYRGADNLRGLKTVLEALLEESGAQARLKRESTL